MPSASPSPGTTGDRPGGVRSVVSRHGTAAFFGGALLLTWVAWGIAYVATSGSPSQVHLLPGAFGPMVAAALVTWAGGGSVRAWAAPILDWRVRPRWYLLALGLPLLLAVGSVAVVLALAGVPLEPSVLAERLPMYPVAFVFVLLVGGGQEEPGWRGFALPRLQRRYSALAASLVIGAVWAVWHAPLFAVGLPRNASGNFLLYAALVVGLSVLLTWCYNGTDGSVLLAMLFHAGVNAAGGLLPASRATVEQSAVLVDAGMTAGVWLVATAVIVRRGPASLADGVPSGRDRSDATAPRD